MNKIFFASDNCAKVHNDILNYLSNINEMDDYSYGEDSLTVTTKKIIQKQFNKNADVHFVYNGTAANVISMKASLRSYEALITSDCSHINDDEAGAFENFVGSKIYALPNYNGKIDIKDAEKYLTFKGSVHQNQPKVISIAQSTENGTCYSTYEINKICEFAHLNDMYVHIDGARIANACAYLNTDLESMVSKTNVDILSLGGTKNGGMFGEVIVVFNKMLKDHVKYTIKQGLNLHSKQRYIAAQYKVMFENNLFYKNAEHANKMAKLLEKELVKLGFDVLYPVEANGVFVKMDKELYNELMEKYFFHEWLIEGSYRLMTSFDTKESDIHSLVDDIKRILKK